MGLRSDLLALAQSSTEAARDQQLTPAEARETVATAKLALEAAALAADTPPSALDEALRDIRDDLAQAGVAVAVGADPTETVVLMAQTMRRWRETVAQMEAAERAYIIVRDCAEKLVADFEDAGTETSLRIAGRVRGALDDAATLVDAARPSPQALED